MSTTLYWLQCGGCGGDTMSFLNAESPDIVELLNLLDIEVLWHPSLSNNSLLEQREISERLLSGEQKLDILCIEGSIIRGPNGTGMYDLRDGKPKKDLVASLAKQAQFVVGRRHVCKLWRDKCGRRGRGYWCPVLQVRKGWIYR